MAPPLLDFSILFDPSLAPAHAVFVFCFGALWGSFLNVCIYRMPAGQSIVSPRSYCYRCGTTIAARDNVPILSYLALRGRCRHCRGAFSARYALIEAFCGLLFLLLFLQYGWGWALPVYWIFTGLLLVATFTDLDHWTILDRVSLGGAGAGLVLALALPWLPPHEAGGWALAQAGPFAAGLWWGPAANALVGMAVGAGLLWAVGFLGSVAFRKPAMGLGDVKLLLLIGAFCGWPVALLSIFLASFFGSAWGLSALAVNRQRARRTPTSQAPPEAERYRELLGEAPERFSDTERAALLQILARPTRRSRPPAPHHLPFGPHLAAAAWLLLATQPWWMPHWRDYLNLLREAFAMGVPMP